MPLYALDGVAPELEDPASTWIAPDAHVIGRVRLSRRVNIWFGAVVRGDNEPILIGEATNLQEHVTLHSDPGSPLTIGARCTLGHRAMLHGCTIEDGALIGIGATVLNGARIGRGSLVGAHSLVTEGKVIPEGSLVMGSPARVVRALSPEEIARLAQSAAHYVENARRFRDGLTLIS